MIKKYFAQFKFEFIVCILLLTITVISTIFASVILTALLEAIINKSFDAVLIAIFEEIFVWTLLLISNYFQNRVQANLIRKINLTIKENITQMIIHQSLDQTPNNDDTYTSLYVNDCELIEANVFNNFFRLIYDYEIVIFSFISLLMYDLLIALCTIVFFIIIYYFPKLFEHLAQQITQDLSDAKSNYLNQLNNQINGFNVYTEYNRLNTMQTKINDASTHLEKAKLFYQIKMNFIDLMMGIINVVAQLGTIIVTAILASLSMINASVILSIGNLSGMFYNALSEISNLKVTIKSTEPLLTKFDVTQTTQANKNSCPVINKLELNDLTFKYDQKTVFQNANFIFEKSKKYLIVGKNGCGKTTLLKLLTAQLRPTGGSYMINGNDAQAIATTSINDRISFIHQNPYLFNDTVIFNLTLGEDFSVDEVNAVIRKCRLVDFIKTYGFDHIIEGNSNNISAGQKQKIAIARVLLRKKQVILIDEAAANLDAQSKEEIETILLADPNLLVIMIDHQLKESEYNLFDTIYHL